MDYYYNIVDTPRFFIPELFFKFVDNARSHDPKNLIPVRSGLLKDDPLSLRRIIYRANITKSTENTT